MVDQALPDGILSGSTLISPFLAYGGLTGGVLAGDALVGGILVGSPLVGDLLGKNP